MSDIDLTKQPAYMSVAELRREVVASRQRIRELEEFIEEIDHQYDAMQQIDSWCKAYPHDIFPEPDWVEAREKLGDSLLSRVSAANMRHVTEGIIRIITGCERNNTQ
jgi:hypothetical protein